LERPDRGDRSAKPHTEKHVSKTVYILNGPNLNLLGKREPEIYGSETLADIEVACEKKSAELGLGIRFFQSNAESELIGWIQEARGEAAAIVINPAAYSHTSVAILDALKMFDGPVMEVHISNIHKRESFRHHSYVSHRADGIIAGCGTQGYLLALERIAQILA
jgi:3-dehydroquinate dehydratase-2